MKRSKFNVSKMWNDKNATYCAAHDTQGIYGQFGNVEGNAFTIESEE